jgi:S-formylglutathione hydrolase
MSDLEVLSEHASFGGTQGFYKHTSASSSGPMRFGVYRPPQAASGKVPVVFYLAGLTCTEETFAMKAGAQRVAAELGLMLVTPDTSPRAARFPGDDASWDFGVGAGFYVDATREPWSAAYRMFTYVTEELPALVAKEFAADTARMGIFGHSMGGHGALVIGLRRADRFRSVSALAPIASPTRCPWGKKAFSGYLGDDEAAWRAYDACELLAKHKAASPLLVDQGTKDKFLTEQLKPELLEEACAKHGQELVLRRREGYDHSYYFVSTCTEDHLRHHAAHLKKI